MQKHHIFAKINYEKTSMVLEKIANSPILLNCKKLLKYLPFQLIIWFIYTIWTGLNWYSYQPEKLGHIISYKLFQFIPGIIISLLIIATFWFVINRFSKPQVLVLIFIVTSIFFAALWAPAQDLLLTFFWHEAIGQPVSLRNIIKAVNFNLFVFICLNSTPYIQFFWVIYEEKKKNLAQLSNNKEKNGNKKLGYNDKVYVSNKYSPNFITVNSIKIIYADGYYSYSITDDNRKITLYQTLKKWEEILPIEHFFRIHRSTIINIEHIDKIEELKNNTCKVFLKNSNEPTVMSRRLGIIFKERYKV